MSKSKLNTARPMMTSESNWSKRKIKLKELPKRLRQQGRSTLRRKNLCSRLMKI
jgi:hypothetical protein